MTGLVFASREETVPFLARYERGRSAGMGDGERAHDPRLVVTLTGVGKIKATLRTERLLQAGRDAIADFLLDWLERE